MKEEVTFDFVVNDPGDDVVPLSPTIAHGFRIHDVVEYVRVRRAS